MAFENPTTPRTSSGLYHSRFTGEEIDNLLSRVQNGEAGSSFGGGAGVRSAKAVIGTTTAGHTQADCDFLCDGDQDEEQVLAAIASLPSQGGEVVFLEGVYYIIDTVALTRDNITITGQGNGTRLCFDNFFGAACMTITGDGCCVRNLRFSHVSYIAIRVEGANYTKIQHVDTSCLSEDEGESLRVIRSNYTDVVGCTFSGPSGSGVDVDKYSRKTTFTGCHISCYTTINGEASVLSGNVIDGGLEIGDDAHRNVITGNYITSTDDTGRNAINGSRCTVVGNIFYHNGHEGDPPICLEVCGHENIIMGNHFTNGIVWVTENAQRNDNLIRHNHGEAGFDDDEGTGLSEGGMVTGTLQTRDVQVGSFYNGQPVEGGHSSLRVNGTIASYGDCQVSGSFRAGGTVEVDGQSTFSGTLNALGDMSVGGSATVNGTLRAKGDFITHGIKPESDNTYHLGNTSKRFKNGYFSGTVNAGQIIAPAVNATNTDGEGLVRTNRLVVEKTALLPWIKTGTLLIQEGYEGVELETLPAPIDVLAKIRELENTISSLQGEIRAIQSDYTALARRVRTCEGELGLGGTPETPPDTGEDGGGQAWL